MPTTIVKKVKADDYLKEFASLHKNEPWLILLIEQIISGKTVLEKNFLKNIYKTLLKDNNLISKKVNMNSQTSYVSSNTSISHSRPDVSNFILKSLTNQKGINALVQGATINFHPKLTVIYGKNGSGKSGFVRIIKKISGSRTQEDIWQDIHKSKTKNQYQVKIIYENNNVEVPIVWNGDKQIPPFDQLNVFDGKCIPIYLTTSLDFSYQPYGFDLFQIVSKSLQELQSMTSEDIAKKELEKPTFDNLFDNRTSAGKFVDNLSANTKKEDLNKFPKWNQKLKHDLSLKNKEKRSLQNVDMQTELLENRLQKINTLKDKLKEIQSELSSQNITKYFKLIKNFNYFKKRLTTKKGKELEDYRIPKMESDEWHDFIEAGEKYHVKVYNENYSVEDHNCIYCRQKLISSDTKKLIKLYHEIFKEKESSEFESSENELNKAFVKLSNIFFSESFSYKKNDFKRILPTRIIETFFKTLNNADELIKIIKNCLNEKRIQKIKLLNLNLLIGQIEKIQNKVTSEIVKQSEAKKNSIRHLNEIEIVIRELLDLRKLSKHRSNIEKYILCEQWITKANSILGKLNTRSITDLGSKAWKELVSDLFKKQFEDEIIKLDAPKINLEFRGERGSQLREKNLEGLSKIDDFLSEGEQKAVALGDFFAELSILNLKNPIIFDDPATSFDHERKQKIAKRIVDESELRQVIVFTHDLMFASNIHDLVLDSKDKDKIDIVSEKRNDRYDIVRYRC